MKAGVLGVPHGDFDTVDSVRYSVAHEAVDRDLLRCIEILNNGSLPDGQSYVHGQAAKEVVDEEEDIQIRDNSITVAEEAYISAKYTEFVAIPGRVVIPKSSSGTFVFNMISRQVNTTIERGQVNLREFYEVNGTADVWQAGFYDTGGNANNGMLYGDNVMNDSEFERVLEHSQLNQLGLEYEMDSDPIKMTITESGYVNVYQPSNYESKDFLDYIQKEVLPVLDTE